MPSGMDATSSGVSPSSTSNAKQGENWKGYYYYWPVADLEQELAAIDDPFQALQHLLEHRYVGVLYRRYGAEAAAIRSAEADGTKKSRRVLETSEGQLISRREAFHRLLGTTPIKSEFTLPVEDRTNFQKEFAALATLSLPPAEFGRRLVGQLEEVVNKYWIYFEPTQIVLRRTEDKLDRTEAIPAEIRELTERLLTLEGVLLYEDVAGPTGNR